MNCHSDLAKEIIQINNELFKILFEVVGDTISYNGLTTLQHIDKYIQEEIDEENKAKEDINYSEEFKENLLRHYRSFNEFSYLINEAKIICNQDKLQKELPEKQDKRKKKINI